MANGAPAWTIDEAAATADTEPGSGQIASVALPVSGDHLVTTDAGSALPLREVVDSGSLEEPDGQSSEVGGRVARNFGVLVGGQAVTWTMTLLWTLIVPRALGPVRLGILVSAQSVAGVLGIALGMGTRNYLVRETVITRGAGPKLVGTALILRLTVSPMVGLAAVGWARIAHYGHDATRGALPDYRDDGLDASHRALAGRVSGDRADEIPRLCGYRQQVRSDHHRHRRGFGRVQGGRDRREHGNHGRRRIRLDVSGGCGRTSTSTSGRISG